MNILAGTRDTGTEGMDINHVALTSPPVNSGATPPAYEDFYPYYAELCALTEIRKIPGIGVPLNSGIGGHVLLYLNGVRLDHSAGYPVIRLCTPDEPPANYGVALSVNSHFRNANWVAVEGRDFIWRGALAPGERLTRDVYERTQTQAKALGVLDGIEFHEELFRAKPSGMSDRDYKYEISIATDYGAQFGRDSYRARIPLDRARIGIMVDYLNAENLPYRNGERFYRWSVFNNNCVHVAHNALALAGVWKPWPAGQWVVTAAFKFPVPKNAFVDLMLRANDLPLEDAQALYKDKAARRALLAFGTLPTAPGALASTVRAIEENDLYDIDTLRLIFFDNPYWGPYRFAFKRIFNTPRYTDLRTNLRYFAERYEAVLARGPGKRKYSGERALFQTRYEEYAGREAARAADYLTRLDAAP